MPDFWFNPIQKNKMVEHQGVSVKNSYVPWCNPHRIYSGKICNIKITQEPVKVLGIWISKNPHEIQTLHLDQRIDKLKRILNVWKQLGLTIKGNIAIVKAKALPLITYVTNFIYVLKMLLKQLTNYCMNLCGRKNIMSKGQP